MKYIVGFFLLVSPQFALAQNSLFSAKTMETQDKLFDAEVDQSIVRASLEEAISARNLMVTECRSTRRLFEQGYAQYSDLWLCDIELAAASSKVEQYRASLNTMQRNAAIWSERLKGERGEPMDEGFIAKLYHEKWNSTLIHLNAQIAAAKQVRDNAIRYQDWCERQRPRGYLSELEFTKAQIAVENGKRQVEMLEIKATKVQEYLLKTAQDMASYPAMPTEDGFE